MGLNLSTTDSSIIETQDDRNRTALSWAIEYGNNDIVSLLIRNNALLAVPDKDGRTPLHWAVIARNSQVVNELLSTQGMRYHYHLELMFPMKTKNERADMLRSYYRNYTNQPDIYGNTPLHFAIHGALQTQGSDRTDIIKMLMTHHEFSGIQVLKSNHENYSPLEEALRARDMSIFQLLLEGIDMDFNHIGHFEQPLLHQLIRLRWLEGLDKFIEKGLNI